jgi:hypothetical protein
LQLRPRRARQVREATPEHEVEPAAVVAAVGYDAP